MDKMSDYANHSPQDVRRMIREGKWDRPTSGICAGHVQAICCEISIENK